MSDQADALPTAVDAASAVRLFDSGGEAWLLDVREPEEWREGHAPQANSVPLTALGNRLAELPDDVPIYVICHSGSRSARAVRALRTRDYVAINIDGGMLEWAAAGGSVVREQGTEPGDE